MAADLAGRVRVCSCAAVRRPASQRGDLLAATTTGGVGGREDLTGRNRNNVESVCTFFFTLLVKSFIILAKC